jgi:glucose/arabinose dehydrogenase
MSFALTLRLPAAMLGTIVAVQATAAQAPGPPGMDSVGAHWSYETEGTRYRVEVVANGIATPWGLAFLPGGQLLASDRRAGRLLLVDSRRGRATEVAGVPRVWGKGDAGLLDVVLHPGFARNGWIYFSYSALVDSASTLAVDRARLRDSVLVDRERLFTARHPLPDNTDHFGGRLVLDGGYLFISSGDRATHRDSAQSLTSHYGKILRLHDDGRVPNDNPFAGRAGALREIWSLGHRNPQGLTLDPVRGELWEGEHGPKGGDEINIVRRGANYGWPVISHGEEYKGGPVGAGITEREGMEQPLHFYRPSIAPSGMEFYTASAIPGWRGNLFQGALALTHLNRLVLRDGKVVHEERLLADRKWRVRVVRQGPDGFLYVGVDGGMILRIRPDVR